MGSIELKGVTVGYGRRIIFQDLSLNLSGQGIVALVAPNGAGKSTLLNAILNLVPLRTGTIHINGQGHRKPAVFHSVGYVKDERLLYPYLTGYEHLALVARLNGISRQTLQDVIIAQGLADYAQRKVATYSLGMKQNLLLTLATLHHPQVLILDEPQNGFDPGRVIQLRQLLKERAAAGTLILMASHTLSEIEALTREVLFLKDGRLIHESLADGQSSLEARYRAHFLTDETTGSLI